MEKKVLHLAACVCGQGDEYQRPLLQEVTHACTESNIKLSVFLAFSSEDMQATAMDSAVNIFNLINFQKYDGLLLFSLSFQNSELLQPLISRAKEAGIPVICLDGEEEGCLNISVDYDDAVALMTTHFIEKHGFTKINYIGGKPGFSTSVLREDSYRQAMQAHGMTVEEERIGCGMFWSDPAAQYVKEYYQQTGGMPEAFVCGSDPMAIGAIRAIQALGFRVPEDVAVSGVDGNRRALNYYPALTTAAPNLEDAAKLAISKFLEIVEQNAPATGYYDVPCAPCFQESCGCSAYTHAINSEIKENLLDEIDNHETYLYWSRGAIESMTDVHDKKSLIEALNRIANHFWTGNCWFCLCDNFLDNDDDQCGTSGYTDIIYPIVHARNHQPMQHDSFPVTEMLPDYDEAWKDSNAIIFVPLYFTDHPVGYIATEYTSLVLPLNMLANLCCTLSVLLENARIRFQLERMVNRFQNLSIMDAMTGLYNRRGFYMKMNAMFDACIASRESFMTISIDLDGLKEINDNYGHHQGDHAIQMMAELLLQVCAECHIAARFGGDEFVIAGKFAVTSHPEQMIHTIEGRLRELNAKSGQEYTVGMSSGWYMEVPSAGNCVDEWIAIADERMYSVKKVHKNRVRTRK